MEVPGWVFAVKEVRTITKKDKKKDWAKISWCAMTRNTGRGNRWVIVKKLDKKSTKKKRKKMKRPSSRKKKFVEMQDEKGRAICTWVPKAVLPPDVCAALKQGKATWKSLLHVPQRNRVVRVAPVYHPATATEINKRINSFFGRKKTIPVTPAKDHQFGCHISVSDTDAEQPRKRSRLGLRVCPQTGFTHDWSWFHDEHGDKAEEMWDKADVDTDTEHPHKRSRLGVRVCPQTGFTHDWSWFHDEFGGKAEEMWDKADAEEEGEPNSKDDNTGKTLITAENNVMNTSVIMTVSSSESDATTDDGIVTGKIVPEGMEHRLDRAFIQLNAVLEELPDTRKRQHLIDAYRKLCRYQFWNTVTAQKQFPMSRFIRFSNIQYPCSKIMCVSESRTSWKCALCPDIGQDMSQSVVVFHKQNCARHFRSNDHCVRAAAEFKHGNSLNDVVQYEKEAKIYTSELPQAIVDDAIFSCAKKSLSLTAIPVLLDVVTRALRACRGKSPVPVEEIMKIRTVSPEGAKALTRLNSSCAPTNVRGETGGSGSRSRSACSRGRKCVTGRLLHLSNIVVQQKCDFLIKCPYLSCTCDESDTFSSSAPLAAALQGCSTTFEWANLFMGQTDVAQDKTGKGCYDGLKTLLNPQLYDSIVWLATDGASAMRSTPHYAGLQGNPVGTSLQAHMIQNGKPRLPNLHCLTHMLNLSLKKAFKENGHWSDQWMDHIKAMFNWFSKSPSRKSALKRLHASMDLLRNVVGWKMVYPKYYCPTRWLGILRAVRSILKAEKLLEAYSDGLMQQGYRPDRRAVDEDEGVRGEARVEEDDGDEHESVHSESFHTWGLVTDRYTWDLNCISPVGDVDIESSLERLSMETGRARTWQDMIDGVGKKKSKLLSEKIGVTTQMLGLDAILADAMEPYELLVQRLQTQCVPVAPRVRKWTCEMFKNLQSMFLIESPTYGKHFQRWLKRDDINEHLGDQVRAMGRSFVYDFLKDVKRRFRPYWNSIMAWETINPCAPHRLSDDAWEGVKEMCERCMPDVAPEEVVAGLKKQHEDSGEWCMAELRMCKSNLLRFYHDRRAQRLSEGNSHMTPLEKFALLVFSIHVSSSGVESYFSKTNYTKNKYRSSMRDEVASAYLHIKETRNLIHREMLEPTLSFGLDLQRPFRDGDMNLTELRSLYMNAKIIKPFVDGGTGELRPYTGRVDQINWDKGESCYMFHIYYEDDDDEEDMEYWVLKKYVQDM